MYEYSARRPCNYELEYHWQNTRERQQPSNHTPAEAVFLPLQLIQALLLLYLFVVNSFEQWQHALFSSSIPVDRLHADLQSLLQNFCVIVLASNSDWH